MLSAEDQERKISRRRLLKIVATTGGATAASTLLPTKWTKPVVEVGLLPAHAQVTPPPTQTPTLEPTIIVTCHLANTIAGVTEIEPTDTVETYVTIRTPRADIESIELRMELSLDRGTGSPETLVTETGTPTITPANNPNEATYQPADVDLTPFGANPGDTLAAMFSFVNASDGNDTCVRTSEIATP